jgi:hypothetical protein
MRPNNNTALWDSVFQTDPKHTKGFKRAGGFSGTAIKPLYLIHKATELWGSMGDAWGAESGEPVISGVTVFIKARLWYPAQGGKAWVEHWGGDVLVKGDAAKPNDEAVKMAFTDAVGKCLVQLGFSADVHMGLFDDNKYVEKASAAHEPVNEKSKLFANSSLRNAFIDKVVDSFNTASTMKELDAESAVYKDKLTDMRASESQWDREGAAEAGRRYLAAKNRIELKEQQEASFPQGFNEVSTTFKRVKV